MGITISRSGQVVHHVSGPGVPLPEEAMFTITTFPAAVHQEGAVMESAPVTPSEDVFEELPDGRVVQVGIKGRPMPYQEAMRLGLVKDKQAGPSQNKVSASDPPVDATPEAAALAEQHGLDLAALHAAGKGTGKDGRVLVGDVENEIAQQDE